MFVAIFGKNVALLVQKFCVEKELFFRLYCFFKIYYRERNIQLILSILGYNNDLVK